MTSTALEKRSRQYDTVAKAIAFIRNHARSQPSLREIAQAVALSEFHFQKIFAEWAGISPKRFLQYVTKEYARQALHSAKDVLSVALKSGLSGPGRLHDLMVTCEAMSPGEIKARGAGIEIRYGIAATPFGRALIARTERGVCHLEFLEACSEESVIAGLRDAWTNATLREDPGQAMRLSRRIFQDAPRGKPLHLMLRGTNFQIKVWEALLRVGRGEIISYGQLARMTGVASARRAVGSALGKNTIAFLVPCHRVIRESGDTGNYRWGRDRKAALLAWEAARAARLHRVPGEIA